MFLSNDKGDDLFDVGNDPIYYIILPLIILYLAT